MPPPLADAPGVAGEPESTRARREAAGEETPTSASPRSGSTTKRMTVTAVHPPHSPTSLRFPDRNLPRQPRCYSDLGGGSGRQLLTTLARTRVRLPRPASQTATTSLRGQPAPRSLDPSRRGLAELVFRRQEKRATIRRRADSAIRSTPRPVPALPTAAPRSPAAARRRPNRLGGSAFLAAKPRSIVVLSRGVTTEKLRLRIVGAWAFACFFK